MEKWSARSSWRVGIVWISKPVYECLPYFYLLVGAVSLAASMYVSYDYWPSICFGLGLLSLVAGLVVLLKRRDSRLNERRSRPS